MAFLWQGPHAISKDPDLLAERILARALLLSEGYRRPAASCWAFFCRRGRRCLFFESILPFFMDVPGVGASCVAPASEAFLSATESVAFAALTLIFFSVLGWSAILFSGAVELQLPHRFRTSVDLMTTSTKTRPLFVPPRVERFFLRYRMASFFRRIDHRLDFDMGFRKPSSVCCVPWRREGCASPFNANRPPGAALGGRSSPQGTPGCRLYAPRSLPRLSPTRWS